MSFRWWNVFVNERDFVTFTRHVEKQLLELMTREPIRLRIVLYVVRQPRDAIVAVTGKHSFMHDGHIDSETMLKNLFEYLIVPTGRNCTSEHCVVMHFTYQRALEKHQIRPDLPCGKIGYQAQWLLSGDPHVPYLKIRPLEEIMAEAISVAEAVELEGEMYPPTHESIRSETETFLHTRGTKRPCWPGLRDPSDFGPWNLGAAPWGVTNAAAPATPARPTIHQPLDEVLRQPSTPQKRLEVLRTLKDNPRLRASLTCHLQSGRDALQLLFYPPEGWSSPQLQPVLLNVLRKDPEFMAFIDQRLQKNQLMQSKFQQLFYIAEQDLNPQEEEQALDMLGFRTPSGAPRSAEERKYGFAKSMRGCDS